MDFKLNINRLPKEDLEYELAIRGASPKPTVNEMRSFLRQLKKISTTSTSFVKPIHPYTYAEDAAAIQAKFTIIESLIKDFVGTRSSSEYAKISSAFAFISGRIDNAQPKSEEENKERSSFAIRVADLAAQFQSKLKTLERASTQSILNTTTIGIPLAQGSSGESDDEDSRPSSPVPANASTTHVSFTPSPKAVPVASWGLKFSGLRKDISVSAFLERVSELKISRNSTDQLLFNAAVDLFEGPALIWYRANRDLFANWSELAVGLRHEFQAVDYDEKLFEEIRHRTQGDHETIGLYVSVMKNLFARLSAPVSEKVQLRILQRNILPFYQTQMGLTEVSSIAELLKYGKILEARKASVEAYVPPPLRGKSLEPDLAYVGSEPLPNRQRINTAVVNPPGPTPVKCWNCNRTGHPYPRCPMPLKRFCFRCGKPDVTVPSCPQCSGNASRAH